LLHLDTLEAWGALNNLWPQHGATQHSAAAAAVAAAAAAAAAAVAAAGSRQLTNLLNFNTLQP
jgi:hypothetical protein